MSRIAALLDGRVWDADTLDHIADLVRESGRMVRDVDDVPSSYRITYGDATYEYLDGEDAFYRDLDDAIAAFTTVLQSQPFSVGTVALWTVGADDEWDCVASCDLARLARTAD